VYRCRIQFWLESVSIGHPLKGDASDAAFDQRLFPRECRERGISYTAPLRGRICRRVNGGAPSTLEVSLGDVPIMVRSSHCHLRGLSPRELVAAGEEASEFGGYFICNGIERIIRMLQIPKRNYPMAVTRSAYTNRGPLYSNKGIIMRCVRPDQSGITLTLHYLEDGSATVRFAVRRQEFFLPVVMLLKALVPTTDREIYERVVAGDTTNTYLSDRVLMLLREAKRYASALHSQDAALSYLGSRFRAVVNMPKSLSDTEAGRTLLDRYVLVHIPPECGREKFDVLLLMLRKLYGFVRGDVLEDNPDSLANHELLLSGHLVQMVLKEKLHEMLMSVETAIVQGDALAKRPRGAGDAVAPVNLHDGAYFRKVC
jgi:DNA-directed RNA polymerase I subunit RPA2